MLPPSIEIYLEELNTHFPLSRDEEVELAQRIREGDEQALEKLGREPDTYELAAQTRMRDRDVIDALKNVKHELSLDHPLVDDEQDNLIDFLASDRYVPPDEALMYESLQTDVNKVISNLEPRSAEIIRRYFGLNGYSPHSLGMIGEQFQLTRERIRQIKKSALKSLRQKPSVRNLKKYL